MPNLELKNGEKLLFSFFACKFIAARSDPSAYKNYAMNLFFSYLRNLFSNLRIIISI